MSRLFLKSLQYLPHLPYSEQDRFFRQKFPETDHYQPTRDGNGINLISDDMLKLFEGTDHVGRYEELETRKFCAILYLDPQRNCVLESPIIFMVSRQFFNSLVPWFVTDGDRPIQERELQLFLQCETFKFATGIDVGTESGILPEKYGTIDESTGKRYVVAEHEATPLSKALDLLRPQLQVVTTGLPRGDLIWASFPHLKNIYWYLERENLGDFVRIFMELTKSNKSVVFFANILQNCGVILNNPWLINYDGDLITVVSDMRRKKFLTFLQLRMIDVLKQDPQHFENCVYGFIHFVQIDNRFTTKRLEDEWEDDWADESDRQPNFPDDTVFEQDDPYLSEIDFYYNKPLLSLQLLQPTPIAVLDPILDYFDAIIRNGDLHRLPFEAQHSIVLFYDNFSVYVLNTSEKRKEFILGDRYSGATLLNEMLQSLMKQYEIFRCPQKPDFPQPRFWFIQELFPRENSFQIHNEKFYRHSVPSELINAISRCFFLFLHFLDDRYWVENIPVRFSDEHLHAMIQSGRRILAHFPFKELKSFLEYLPALTFEEEYRIIEGKRMLAGFSYYSFKNLCQVCEQITRYMTQHRHATEREADSLKLTPLFFESEVLFEWFKLGDRCLLNDFTKGQFDKTGRVLTAISLYAESVSKLNSQSMKEMLFERPYETELAKSSTTTNNMETMRTNDDLFSWFKPTWQGLLNFFERFSSRASDRAEALITEVVQKHKEEIAHFEQMIRDDFRKKKRTENISTSALDQLQFTTACKLRYLKSCQHEIFSEELKNLLRVVEKVKENLDGIFLKWTYNDKFHNAMIGFKSRGQTFQRALERLLTQLETAEQCTVLGPPPMKDQFFEKNRIGTNTRRERE